MTLPDDDDDNDLRKAFAGLRLEDRSRAPSFEALLQRSAGRGRRGRRLPPWSALLAAAALCAAVWIGVALDRATRSSGSVASIDRWTAPTDFLLRTPGSELLETVPRIGARPGLLPSAPAAPREAVRKPRSVSP